MKPVIFGCSGKSLTDWEKDFFSKVKPYGFILFARNCDTPEQIIKLTNEMKSCVGKNNIPILIDQEGGRVARLKSPYWREAPTASVFAELAKHGIKKAKEAVYLNARLIASELHHLGITVNCTPLADIPTENSHDIIGDRAFGDNPDTVSELAFSMCEGLLDGGVLPVIKHIPGHGRATADSHKELPIVDASLEVMRTTDFIPFMRLKNMPIAMTAHILYTAIDNTVSTFSPKVIELIRNEIGFDGLLLSDDLSMQALDGDFGERAVRTLQAGCDIILHCNGDKNEMLEIAEAIGEVAANTLRRIANANKFFQTPKQFDYKTAEIELDNLLSNTVA